MLHLAQNRMISHQHIPNFTDQPAICFAFGKTRGHGCWCDDIDFATFGRQKWGG